ncbi:DDE-type integrase/transposase/recombinase [Gilliamella sp. Pas-s25]|nr:DDE-type integrase/transposase/recombinase [Gilliamella sp. Pas-s25]
MIITLSIFGWRIYSDNGRENQGTGEHLFVKTCNNHYINQKVTKPACPQTKGKSERMIRALIWKYGIISKYLKIQKISNKNLIDLLIL